MSRPHPHPRPWHRGSLFGAGPRRPLDRDQRARFRFLLNTHHRAGRLTRAARDVGEALVRRVGTDGQCDPSHATLAEDAACEVRTVQRATDAMRDVGLLTWQRRLVRNGWRAEQTSNAYMLTAAEVPIVPLRCGGHSARETLKEVNLPSSPPSAAVLEAVAALAQRRREMELRLLNGGAAGRSAAG